MRVETLPVGELSTNCYIVSSGKDAVVIDPGKDADLILKKLRELDVVPSYIFLTHAHFDHILAVNEIKKKTGARIVANEGERKRLSDAHLSGATLAGAFSFEPIEADVFVSDGDFISVGDLRFDFMLTPGHTEGSMCIFCEDVIFSGDTLFEGTCGRCDLPGGDIADMMKSLKKLYLVPGDFKVLPGHGGSTSLSRERTENIYMAEAMRR